MRPSCAELRGAYPAASTIVPLAYVGSVFTADFPVDLVVPVIFETSAASILRRFSFRMMSKTESITNEMFDVSVAQVAWQYTWRFSGSLFLSRNFCFR